MRSPHSFHHLLAKYINGGPFSRSDSVISSVFPKLFSLRYAKWVQKGYLDHLTSLQVKKNPSITVPIHHYKGNNPSVQRMMEFLDRNLRNELLGAYIHGSLGTYEEIPYSDFDGLVVIKNETFRSRKMLARVAYQLSKAKGIMLDFDPLQHHGWFVLTEADFNCYPEHYFPIDLFNHAKSLFIDTGNSVEANVYYSKEKMEKAFNKMVDAVVLKIQHQRYPENIRHLKSLLSQFMLLPTLYYQAKNGKGIFKKESFEIVKQDFKEEDWLIMDRVSEIRRDWKFTISGANRILMSQNYSWSRYCAHWFAPKIPSKINKNLNHKFYHDIKHLSLEMKKNIL